MTDNLSSNKRSWNMARIRSSNTIPEKIIRNIVRKMGYKFKVNNKNLPGKPDIILDNHHVAIFVHGCFWHCHKGCKDFRIPKTNISFWKSKLNKNAQRDKRSQIKLRNMRWKTIIIWECELNNIQSLKNRIRAKTKPNKSG